METTPSRKNSHKIIAVAEANKNVVRVPRVLEVTKVELPVTVRVPVHVRYPAVAVSVPQAAYILSSVPPNPTPARFCIIYKVFPLIVCTDLYLFFTQDRTDH
jgi:hypothetical protein